MKKNNFKNNLEKTQRPQSSISLHNLPNLGHKKPKSIYPKITSMREMNINEFDPYKTYIPKLESEKLYKNNIDLKQTINDLNKKIDFLKSNNQKLSLIITKKDKEIDELTNQVILKNKELVTKEKKEKQNKNKIKLKEDVQNIDKDKDGNKNGEEKKGEKIKENTTNKKIRKQNIFEKDLQIKKCNNEIFRIKEEYNKLIIEIRNKDQEILNLKRDKKFTDYNEIKIKNEILTKEFNKLREMYLLSLDMNKKNENFSKNENILKAEIQTQHNIIIQLNQEIDNFSLERKKLNTEIKDLKYKLELALNNSKFMENKKDVYEKRYKKKIREQVIQKEYEEEKQQMISKINKLQKNLDHYRLIAMKSKNFGAYDNNKGMINGIQSNNINNASKSYTINNNINRSGITTRAVNPEENYDSKTLLMQSIITELTNEKKELLEKLKLYEDKINNMNIANNSKNNTDKLLQTNEEILKADNNPNPNQNTDNIELNNNNNINENQQENINENQQENINKEEDEDILKEEIKFDDILSLNFEYKNINSSNAQEIFNNIFTQFKDEDKKSDTYKESILSSLVNEISLKLNCNEKEEEKKNIYENLKLYIEQDEDFEANFYIIFDDIINHNDEAIKIIDNKYETIIKDKFKKHKSLIEEIMSNYNDKIRIDTFYDALFEKNIKLKKKVFLYLCYKLKTNECNSLYDIDIKNLSNYIE